MMREGGRRKSRVNVEGRAFKKKREKEIETAPIKDSGKVLGNVLEIEVV